MRKFYFQFLIERSIRNARINVYFVSRKNIIHILRFAYTRKKEFSHVELLRDVRQKTKAKQ